MKSTILQSITALFLALTLVACQNTPATSEATTIAESTAEVTSAPTETVELAALKGATAMGLAQYAKEVLPESEPAINYEIATMPDQVAASLIKGDLDIAIIPANLAATVYNKSEGKIQVAATSVLNVLYFATNQAELTNLEDLRGKTIYTTGQGATPEVILSTLLAKAGLTIGTDVTVEFRSEATEVAALLQAEAGAIAFLPEPFLTSVTMKNEDVKSKLNVSELWQEYVGEDAEVVTGVLVVQKEFVESNKEWFDAFLADYQTSAEWVKANPAEASVIIGEQEIIGAPVAEKAIPKIGITVLTGEEMQAKVEAYLNVLAENKPALVGGTAPAEDFYYVD